MYWFSYGNRAIPYKIDTIGNPYINHPRASQALHTRIATCHAHIGVPHVCHTRAHHAPRLAPSRSFYLHFPLNYKLYMGIIFIKDFKTLKLQIFNFFAWLGVVASHARALPAGPPARATARTRGLPVWCAQVRWCVGIDTQHEPSPDT